MKQILILSFSLIWFSSFGQVLIEPPLHWWVSKMPLENLQELPVGGKVLFQQNCNPEAPTDVPNGVIFFENVTHLKDRLSMAIEFKDTVIVSVTYYLRAKQYALLKHLGYSDIKARGSAIKGQWTVVLQTNKKHTTIVGDRKRITIVETL